MEDKLIDFFYSKSNEELINILSLKRNEYSEEVVTLIENILTERGLNLSLVPTDTSSNKRQKLGDESISKLNRQVYFYLFLAVLSFSSLIISLIPYLRFSVFSILKVFSFILFIGLAISRFMKKGKLQKVKNSIQNSEETYLDIILQLNEHIKNKNNEQISSIIRQNINQSNYYKFNKEFEAECYINLEEALVHGSSQYNQIKQRLQPLIDLNILEKEYPHKQVTLTL
jgi:hypothetical protein